MPRLLLKSGIVVTQDPKLGVLPTGDVLVEDGRIAAIAPKLSADAETIDCVGHFVLPGLVNAHMHTWQTALRSVAALCAEPAYALSKSELLPVSLVTDQLGKGYPYPTPAGTSARALSARNALPRRSLCGAFCAIGD